MSENPENVAIIEQVKSIIENDVRPYIEMDGGTIEFIRYEESVVYVQLAGACSTCPSSTLTLKGGVERAIRRRIPAVRAVELEGADPMAPVEGNTVAVFQL
jgi:NFU1 iron-sulfur cluster scaffold homolog, mitochondrial